MTVRFYEGMKYEEPESLGEIGDMNQRYLGTFMAKLFMAKKTVSMAQKILTIPRTWRGFSALTAVIAWLCFVELIQIAILYGEVGVKPISATLCNGSIHDF